MANLFTLMGTILVDNTKANDSISKTTEKASTFAGKLISGVTTAAKWGAAVTTAAEGVAVALGTKALKSASDFEQQMSNVGTLLSGDADSVSARMQELGNAVKTMSSDTSVSTDLLTDGLYQVISALGDSADSMSILETAAKGAKAGNATVTDSVNLLSAVMKGYNDVSADAASKTSDLAFKTVKLGQTSFPELASSMGKVIPLASTLNVSQEELFTSYATLTGVTGTAAEVTTQMKAALTGLMSPTKQMQEKMKGLGYESGDAMIKALGLEGSFLALKESCGGSDIALAKLFSSTEAQTAVMALAGAQADTYKQKLEEMSDAAGATDTAFQVQTDNFNSRIESIKNKIDVFSIKVGEKLLPIANDVAGWVDEKFPAIESAVGKGLDLMSDGVTFMKDAFSKATELIDTDVIPRVEIFKEALGKLYDATEPIRNAFSELISPLTESADKFDLVSFAVDALCQIIDLSTGAIEILAEGVASFADVVASGIQYFTENVLPKASEKLKEVQEFFQSLGDKAEAFMNNLEPVVDMIKDNFISSLENLKEPMEKIKDAFGKIGDALRELEPFLVMVAEFFGGALATAFSIAVGAINGIISAISGFATMISGVVEIVAGVFQLVVGIFTDNADLCNEAIYSILEGIVTTFGGLWDAVSGFISGFVDGVIGFFQGLWDTLVGHSIVPDTINGIVNCFAGLWEGVSGFISGFVDNVIGFFSNLKESAIQKFGEMKEKTVGKLKELKTEAEKKVLELKTSAINKFNELKTGAVNKASELKTSVVNKFGEIKTGITEKINSARDGVKQAIDKIKGFFKFSWSLPKIKLPHFSISGKFSLNPPSIPKFGVQWYKKAMEQPYLFTRPTIFDVNPVTGTAKGAGEAGEEVMIGKETMLNMIRQAVAAENEWLLDRFDRLIELCVKFFPSIIEALDRDIVLDDGTLVGKMAPVMDEKLGSQQEKKGRYT